MLILILRERSETKNLLLETHREKLVLKIPTVDDNLFGIFKSPF